MFGRTVHCQDRAGWCWASQEWTVQVRRKQGALGRTRKDNKIDTRESGNAMDRNKYNLVQG